MYAGYKCNQIMTPRDPQIAFTGIAGNFICDGCTAINNTDINNTAFGVNGLGNRSCRLCGSAQSTQSPTTWM